MAWGWTWDLGGAWGWGLGGDWVALGLWPWEGAAKGEASVILTLGLVVTAGVTLDKGVGAVAELVDISGLSSRGLTG